MPIESKRGGGSFQKFLVNEDRWEFVSLKGPPGPLPKREPMLRPFGGQVFGTTTLSRLNPKTYTLNVFSTTTS